jgi:AcrR family transcriptional regulator
MPDPSPSAAESRSPRAERSRAAIADAALELIRGGDTRPTAARVAERAGISERLVFHHFTDLEELLQVVADRQVAHVLARAPELPTTGPLEVRLRAVVDARAEMNEWITPVRRASVVREPFSDALAAKRDRLNEGGRVQVAEVFALELAGRESTDAADLLVALDLTLSWPAWEALRTRGASVEQARRVVERTLRALLEG